MSDDSSTAHDRLVALVPDAIRALQELAAKDTPEGATARRELEERGLPLTGDAVT